MIISGATGQLRPVAPEMIIVAQLAQIQLAYKVKQTQPIALTVTIQLSKILYSRLYHGNAYVNQLWICS